MPLNEHGRAASASPDADVVYGTRRAMLAPSQSDRKPKLELRALEVFSTVAETGNMTTAAQKLGMTQPAVSQIFRRLEDEVGCALLDRQLRPLRLTPAGTALFGRAKQLLSDAERLLREVHFASASALPRYRMGFVDSFAATAAPQLVRSMQSEIEQLLVWSGISGDLREAFITRDLDIIISPDPLDGIDGVESHRILRESYVVILPAGLKRQASSLSLSELAARHPLVRFSSRSLMGSQIDRHLRWLRVEAPMRTEFDSSESVLAMVAAGVGWAITTPLTLAQAPGSLSSIVPIPLPGPELARSLFMVHRPGEFTGLPQRVASRCERILRSEIASKLERLAPWLIKHFQVS